MPYPINYKRITSEIDFYDELSALYKEASQYLLGFKWCSKIKESFLYYNLGEVLCIFLFEIENTQSTDDNLLWVIVGDMPPMYLDLYSVKTTKEVLECYIDLATNWICAVKTGKSTNKCFPFNIETKLELAELLEKRIVFMANTLLTNIENIPYHLIK